jgi:hypothetical protein
VFDHAGNLACVAGVDLLVIMVLVRRYNKLELCFLPRNRTVRLDVGGHASRGRSFGLCVTLARFTTAFKRGLRPQALRCLPGLLELLHLDLCVRAADVFGLVEGVAVS